MRRAFVLIGAALLLSACGGAPTRAAGGGHPSPPTAKATTPGSASTSSTTVISTVPPETTGTPRSTLPAPTTTTSATAPPSQVVTATGAGGGLSIALTADPSHGPTGTAVTFTLKATETAAPGALHYQVAYGDGQSDSNITPTVCTSAAPAAQTWTLSHQYATAGTYSVTASVAVNCSPDHATATVSVSRSG